MSCGLAPRDSFSLAPLPCSLLSQPTVSPSLTLSLTFFTPSPPPSPCTCCCSCDRGLTRPCCSHISSARDYVSRLEVLFRPRDSPPSVHTDLGPALTWRGSADLQEKQQGKDVKKWRRIGRQKCTRREENMGCTRMKDEERKRVQAE